MDIQVHVPYRLLQGPFIDTIIATKVNPEVAINHYDLDRFPRETFCETGAKLKEAGVRVTLHAPFVDLRPGAIDSHIRDISRRRIQSIIDLAVFFQPVSIVCHAAFDERYYLSAEEQWLKNSIKTFQSFLPDLYDAACPICIENVYESDPAILRRLMEGVNSPMIGFCFDTGHYNIFSRSSLEVWIETMAPYLKQLHIHDNGGKHDQHLPPGEGTFPFERLGSLLSGKHITPVITLETHSMEDYERALGKLDTLTLPFMPYKPSPV
ncbi:MAG: sugar phosphate isomerase/epimerase [Syntrophobacterales bacterium]|jgi:sugar phosphate isomerase/epimerase|nr:sugar phosphate isomerase/epimerase [Syntrophobacterales bacterium]